jgi:hypothetical protein
MTATGLVLCFCYGSCSLPGESGPPHTTPFTVQDPCFLTFSVGPCQTFSFSMTSFYICLSPRYCGRVSQDSLSLVCSFCQRPQSSSISIGPSLRMIPCYNCQRQTNCLLLPRLALCIRAVTVSSNLTLCLSLTGSVGLSCS